ncbi:sugar-binding transcriptional regulator [Lentilactobacillus sp. SPB1-3]|uniref:Sugar-binding transcriptional regulator n=1 Tax=Lentilactobacillus terminaliae TaxID=3003483 RepID=A0ACD5DFV3_9LACO|nr:sugar-binding transcriptional regulator [Lentilactobacillus sp. SPB1-3]MCZ0976799.1 sugar-binding transcriptional regulator [Lentilactobacillus sp. SPB1-3]
MAVNRDIDKLKLSLQVAEMYYQDNASQSDIAASLNISRPTVSRLLQYAKETGIVKIQIVNPVVSVQVLADKLHEKYGAEFHVVPNNYVGTSSIQDSVGKYAADYLTSIVKPQDVIGIGWGKTIHSVTSHLEDQFVPGVRVVQLKGSVSFANEKTYAHESVEELAKAYHVTPEYLPLPVIFDNLATKQMVEQDRYINNILTLGKDANIALFTVGTVRSEALVFQLGYFDESEIKHLQSAAVGDIVSRFIDGQGRVVDPKIDARTIGIDLSDLQKKEHAILVAYGNQKTAGVHAALKAGYTNCVILDQTLAQLLLDF